MIPSCEAIAPTVGLAQSGFEQRRPTPLAITVTVCLKIVSHVAPNRFH